MRVGANPPLKQRGILYTEPRPSRRDPDFYYKSIMIRKKRTPEVAFSLASSFDASLIAQRPAVWNRLTRSFQDGRASSLNNSLEKSKTHNFPVLKSATAQKKAKKQLFSQQEDLKTTMNLCDQENDRLQTRLTQKQEEHRRMNHILFALKDDMKKSNLARVPDGYLEGPLILTLKNSISSTQEKLSVLKEQQERLQPSKEFETDFIQKALLQKELKTRIRDYMVQIIILQDLLNKKIETDDQKELSPKVCEDMNKSGDKSVGCEEDSESGLCSSNHQSRSLASLNSSLQEEISASLLSLYLIKQDRTEAKARLERAKINESKERERLNKTEARLSWLMADQNIQGNEQFERYLEEGCLDRVKRDIKELKEQIK